MSIKKELLNELTEIQLKAFAETKGVSFLLNKIQKNYYDGWDERDKIVDILTSNEDISVGEIEEFIKITKI